MKRAYFKLNPPLKAPKRPAAKPQPQQEAPPTPTPRPESQAMSYNMCDLIVYWKSL